MAKILVADDDEVMLGLIQTLMELEGNEVVTVTRPEDIVPAVQGQDIALILMDYHLAGGNAVSALRKLKSTAGLQHIPVIVTSGMDRQHECLTIGADSFLLKPFRPAELLEQIDVLVHQQDK